MNPKEVVLHCPISGPGRKIQAGSHPGAWSCRRSTFQEAAGGGSERTSPSPRPPAHWWRSLLAIRKVGSHDARQVRYESLVSKNIAGGLEADDEKPSWRAALQYLTTEILPQEDELPSYWEDAAIVGRPIGSTLHNIKGDAPSSDEDEYDEDDFQSDPFATFSSSGLRLQKLLSKADNSSTNKMRHE